MIFQLYFQPIQPHHSANHQLRVLQAVSSIFPARQEEFFRLFFPLKNKSVSLKRYEQQVDKVTQH
jgi:hypothetical protein